MKHLYTLFIILFVHFSFASNTQSVEFFKGNFQSLKEKAAKEEKLCIVEFFIYGCKPCKRMEQETLSDEYLMDRLDSRFLFYKIDAFSVTDQGFELAKQYNIQAFPTILILHADGTILSRMEGFVDTQTMLAHIETLEVETMIAKGQRNALDIVAKESAQQVNASIHAVKGGNSTPHSNQEKNVTTRQEMMTKLTEEAKIQQQQKKQENLKRILKVPGP